MSHAVVRRLLLGVAVAVTPVILLADQSRAPAKPAAAADLATARPGRDPHQAIDEEYTKKIREYTTEPFFLSPLVDYLPASPTVPTPKAVLGDIAGAPTKLPYSKEVYEYMRALAKASPRVKVYSIGTTEEGREMIAVAVASEELIAKLDENKAKLEHDNRHTVTEAAPGATFPETGNPARSEEPAEGVEERQEEPATMNHDQHQSH